MQQTNATNGEVSWVVLLLLVLVHMPPHILSVYLVPYLLSYVTLSFLSFSFSQFPSLSCIMFSFVFQFDDGMMLSKLNESGFIGDVNNIPEDNRKIVS